ncbi:hypothetical protein U8527_12055 [Kordia algicida OT-1]|uniref:Uncharacterized protein n=1 Tax=Kordia algicida OT-1 TaxID=391587 RepID=A9E0H1_9FLAO|nr:hypothetical protein [Kordia algicida]EDP95853.1 hypothetical protein KAOT1_05597 [Kordia algicida OT-1]
MFEQLFYKTILSYKAQSKKRKHKQLMSMATLYITVLQLSILFVLCIVLVRATNSSFLRFYEIYTPIFYSILAGIVLFLFNAMYFNGKRMLQIKNKAIKENTKGTDVWKLWMIPIVIFALSFILLKAT